MSIWRPGSTCFRAAFVERTDEILHNLDAVQIQIEGKLLRLA